MVNSELEMLKQEIDALREQIYAYMEYPEIFRDELLESSTSPDNIIFTSYINFILNTSLLKRII